VPQTVVTRFKDAVYLQLGDLRAPPLAECFARRRVQCARRKSPSGGERRVNVEPAALDTKPRLERDPELALGLAGRN